VPSRKSRIPDILIPIIIKIKHLLLIRSKRKRRKEKRDRKRKRKEDGPANGTIGRQRGESNEKYKG
jgi:hypothetical protein